MRDASWQRLKPRFCAVACGQDKFRCRRGRRVTEIKSAGLKCSAKNFAASLWGCELELWVVGAPSAHWGWQTCCQSLVWHGKKKIYAGAYAAREWKIGRKSAIALLSHLGKFFGGFSFAVNFLQALFNFKQSAHYNWRQPNSEVNWIDFEQPDKLVSS